ncbi:hypothetical protein OROHE_013102 [Orobanche hederae]
MVPNSSVTMITFMDSKEKLKETEKYLDSQLWHACVGTMVQMPSVNSRVFYFPQGHSEHASENVDFRNFLRGVPPCIPCRVSLVRFMADPGTDEVFAKIRLVPITRNELDFEDDRDIGLSRPGNQEKPTSFAKTLTQSDANNGGGFSVPRYCAETIFPRLDYKADPPVQTILAKDVHGETWKFRHIYRGTPRRHLLTTGWSSFVNHKKLVAGDSVVFMRAENGDLCVGIRQAKRRIGGVPEMQSGWNCGGSFRDNESKLARDSSESLVVSSRGRVKGEDVIEAVNCAAIGRTFDVVYYPRASTPEFCVRASLVRAAMQIRWYSGMRFKMPFETEDSSRISWFMGTVSSVQAADPIQWPDSPWRLLQVAWDEPDLLRNVKRVSPWLVELVSHMPAIHLPHFSPPHKKPRLLHNSEFPPDGQIPLPPFSGNPFGGCPPDNNTPAGMQGARHARYCLSVPDLQMQSDLVPVGFLHPLDRAPQPTSGPSNPLFPKPGSGQNVSCQLTMGNSIPFQESVNSDNGKAATFVLFGHKILTGKQVSTSCSSDTVNSSSEGNGDKMGNTSDGSGSAHIPGEGFRSEETCQCKVFMESEDVGRTLDLSLLRSYEELYCRLADLFGIEISEIANRVLCRDAMGGVNRVGDKSFSDFVKTSRRLTILADSGSDNEGVSIDFLTK